MNAKAASVGNYRVQDRIAVLSINNPPVNALSYEARKQIVEMVGRAQLDTSVDALVLICEGRTFFAGADIREFNQTPLDPRLITVIQCLEESFKPVVAAIHGSALGGGLEIALGCHYRIADPASRLGLPEVKLGLLPGAGGTQRLPRLIGLKNALKMVLGGEPVSATQALELGLIDEITKEPLEFAAVRMARKIIGLDITSRRISASPAPVYDAALFDNAESDVRKKRRGYEAPLACLKAVRAASELPFNEGMVTEGSLFATLKKSSQSLALRHVFFAEREAAKFTSTAQARSIALVAVVGAGTMGSGIAMCFADAGIPVKLLEKDDCRLIESLARIRKNYENSARRGRISGDEAAVRVALITGVTSFDQLHDVDLVVEAVFEEMSVKQEVFLELDRYCKSGAILASNTSYLDVDAIASATRRPADVVGMHFFSPANVMRLLENVRGTKTSESVCKSVMDLGRKLGKVAVLVGLCDGFVGNRMLAKRTRESYFLVQEGASPYQVDRVLYKFGFPMGPFAMADLAGVDVGWRNRQGRLDSLTTRERECDIIDAVVALNRLGQKTAAGYYDYDENRRPSASCQILSLIDSHRSEKGIVPREIEDQEILERCLYSMINEAAYLLEEGIVTRASDIDVVWLNGYGFPAYRGGPLFYADQIGLDIILKGLRKYETKHGSVYWKPSPFLIDLANRGKGFYSA